MGGVVSAKVSLAKVGVRQSRPWPKSDPKVDRGGVKTAVPKRREGAPPRGAVQGGPSGFRKKPRSPNMKFEEGRFSLPCCTPCDLLAHVGPEQNFQAVASIVGFFCFAFFGPPIVHKWFHLWIVALFGSSNFPAVVSLLSCFAPLGSSILQKWFRFAVVLNLFGSLPFLLVSFLSQKHEPRTPNP